MWVRAFILICVLCIIILSSVLTRKGSSGVTDRVIDQVWIGDSALSWITYDNDNHTCFTYGIDECNETITVQTIVLQTSSNIEYVHRAQIGSQTFNKGVYCIGAFKRYIEFQNESKYIIFGDLGIYGDSIPFLLNASHKVDAIIHVGDMAYNLDDDNGVVGDTYMRQLLNITSITPYITLPGNHESGRDYINYRTRFGQTMYYTKETPHAIFIFTHTSLYFTNGVPNTVVTPEMAAHTMWLNQTLSEKHSEDKWVIVFGHHPIYCSAISTGPSCTGGSKDQTLIMRNTFEPLFKARRVHMYVTAHVHAYERLWPTYDGQVLNFTFTNNTYIDSPSYIHVCTGAAGVRAGEEYMDSYIAMAPFSAFQSPGFTRSISMLKIHNTSAMTWEQIDVMTNITIDSFNVLRK